jgi:hypothetical protein
LYLDEHSLSFGDALTSSDPRYRGDRTWVRALLRALEAELIEAGIL